VTQDARRKDPRTSRFAWLKQLQKGLQEPILWRTGLLQLAPHIDEQLPCTSPWWILAAVIGSSSGGMPAQLRLLQPQLALPESWEMTLQSRAELGCACGAAVADAVEAQAGSSADQHWWHSRRCATRLLSC